jgi:heme/copper-type cytochrome/quinol oxidase subunit 2
MWVHHIGEIAMGLMVFLLVGHFGASFYMKYRRRKRNQEKQDLEKD